MPVTAFYAGCLGLLMIALSAQVIVYRRANRLSLGDEGDKVLLQKMRAQGNCTEYAPYGVLLLALCEAQGAPGAALHVLGLMLLTGRVVHAVGFSRNPRLMAFRVSGTMLTLTMMLLASVGLILHSLF